MDPITYDDLVQSAVELLSVGDLNKVLIAFAVIGLLGAVLRGAKRFTR